MTRPMVTVDTNLLAIIVFYTNRAQRTNIPIALPSHNTHTHKTVGLIISPQEPTMQDEAS